MNIFEIIITLAISLGAVVWGVNIYHQKGTWFLAGWNLSLIHISEPTRH